MVNLPQQDPLPHASWREGLLPKDNRQKWGAAQPTASWHRAKLLGLEESREHPQPLCSDRECLVLAAPIPDPSIPKVHGCPLFGLERAVVQVREKDQDCG